MATTTVQSQTLDYLSRRLYQGSSSLVEQQSADGETSLSGFPTRYDGERVWTGPDLEAKQQEWLTVLSEQDHENIIEALRHFQGMPTPTRMVQEPHVADKRELCICTHKI